MKIAVKFFAAARDSAGGRQESIVMVPDGATPADVLALLCRDYPGLERLRAYLHVAVNWEYAALDRPLADGDELAVIPPVSGG